LDLPATKQTQNVGGYFLDNTDNPTTKDTQDDRMNYIKFLAPIPIAVILTVLTFVLFENQPNDNYILIPGTLVKGGLLIYYLRIGNEKTPLINTLTVILLCMLTGEYLFNNEFTGGQLIFIVSNIALIVIYLIRQKLKDKKDRLSGLKSVAVMFYSLTNILYINKVMDVLPLIIGTLILVSVYFYDRLLTIEEVKKQPPTTGLFNGGRHSRP
jgi:hypothetical protein